IGLSELKHSLDISNYDRWVDFERRVISSSINEINKYSQDMQVTYEPQRDGGHSIEKILFNLSSPRARQILNARENKRQRLERKKKKTPGEQTRMNIDN
ncbi:MAG: replication initiation protein, partial [Spirochaetia bacterium]|nr:replication initiation protein [Spirochaetia bacterium]